MLLLKYKVNKFRSVKETDWIEIDRHLTCLVGANESGKTNLLLSLWKFNPADDSITINIFQDYPRDEYLKKKKDNDGYKDGSYKKEPFIEVLFKVTDEELEDFKKKYEDFLKADKTEQSEENTEEKKPNEIALEKFLLIKKDYNGTFYIHSSNDEGKETSNDLKESIGTELFNEICERIPKIIYHSEYGNLDSELSLSSVKETLKNIESWHKYPLKERIQARTLKVFCQLLNLNVDEMLMPNTQKELGSMLGDAEWELAKQFNEWWDQGQYTFSFRVNEGILSLSVKDSKQKTALELDLRSGGLQWFFSFFLIFWAESKDSHQNCILLLDEPGLNLHPNTQADLVKFLGKLSEKNQLIYTTHLPFLVDHNNLDRVRAAYTDEKGWTKIHNDISDVSENISSKNKKMIAIQPVNAAIGMRTALNLFMGCDVIIIEGMSDQIYLMMIQNYLIERKKIKFKRGLFFMPAGGAKNVKFFSSIVSSNTGSLPICLFDSDDGGRKCQNSLKQGLYKSEENKILETDTFTEKNGSEVEDLIPTKLIIDSFNLLFTSNTDTKKVDEIDNTVPILPQLEGFAKSNDVSYGDDWKVKISQEVRKILKGKITSDFENRWIKLFKSLQENFKA
ncbi:ATP-dependent nuclease [Bartonella sp. A05]|uniref:ATP-dependent nuclease n=1 Tax=Bartonella sp. A05 TaxID=2967261 RepID=UPI0022A99EDC|nr:AAA family ATPase [Bartonella sp. A05]MCZ2204009.1 ATP-binding protein [Bartonella sp. A05]